MFDRESAEQRKQRVRDKFNKKMVKEFIDKLVLVHQKNKIVKETEELKESVNAFDKELADVFGLSTKIENELKEYIVILKAKILPFQFGQTDALQKTFDKNLKLLDEYQELIRNELNSDKRDLEMKVIEDFQKLEQNLTLTLHRKLKAEKIIFDQMNQTKKELSEVKNNFKTKNDQFENLSKENRELKVKKQMCLQENKDLLAVYEELKKKNEMLDKKLKKIKVKSELKIKEVKIPQRTMPPNREPGSSSTRYLTINSSKHLRNSSLATTSARGEKTASLYSCFSSSDLLPCNNLNEIAKFLSEKNLEIKKNYNEARLRNGDLIREKNQLSQFVQKCIEDVKLDYKYLSTTDKIKLPSDLKTKQLELLKKANEKLSLIYDNCFTFNKSVKRRNRSVIRLSSSYLSSSYSMRGNKSKKKIRLKTTSP